MTQKSKSRQWYQHIFVGCGLVASVLLIVRALLLQGNHDTFLLVSLGLCMMSMLTGVGYFALNIRVPGYSRPYQTEAASTRWTFVAPRILALSCNLAALIAVFLVR